MPGLRTRLLKARCGSFAFDFKDATLMQDGTCSISGEWSMHFHSLSSNRS